MQFLAFTRPHDIAKLGDALWAAFPQWFYQDSFSAHQRTDVTLSGDGANGYIMFPDSTPISAVEAVIDTYQLAPEFNPPAPISEPIINAPVRPMWQHLIGAGWIWDNAP